MNDQKNLILAIAMSMVVIIAYQLLFLQPQKEAQQAQQAQVAPSQTASGDGAVPGPYAGDSAIPSPPGGGGAVPAAERGNVLAAAPRIQIETPSVRGSIRLTGGRLDDLVLTNYHQTVDPQSPEIVLFSPAGSDRPYYAQYGWVPATSGDAPKLPGAETEWSASGGPLSPGQPVTLTWDNGEGLHFERVIEVDDTYLLTLTQRVRNAGDTPVELLPYGLVARLYVPDTLGFYILHEGPLGVFDDTLTELDYDDLAEDGPITQESTGGWLGITDKYWMAALIPDQDSPVTARFLHTSQGANPRVQADYLGARQVIQPGATAETKSRLFAGAKRVDLIESYQERYGIERFDLAIDWGWFYFLTKPIYHILHWIYGYVGNYGVSIILLTVFLKLLMFPLANKSYKSMAKLKKLQPKMLELREKYGDDKQRLNQEMMGLYKKEGANPASGCLPILVQIPVFFSLYKVLFVTIEMRHAPFFGWIRDLSAPDPTTLFNLFGLIPWTPPEWLIPIGVWPLIMGGTMWLQQRLNPQPPDPVQAKVMMFLPVIFTVMLASFPAGLVVYWTANNLLSVAQQWLIMRSVDAKPAPAAPPAPANQSSANPGSGKKPSQKKQKKA